MVTCVDGQANIHIVFKLHISVEWYSVTNRCYAVQFYYTVIFHTSKLRHEQQLLLEAIHDGVILLCYVIVLNYMFVLTLNLYCKYIFLY